MLPIRTLVLPNSTYGEKHIAGSLVLKIGAELKSWTHCSFEITGHTHTQLPVAHILADLGTDRGPQLAQRRKTVPRLTRRASDCHKSAHAQMWAARGYVMNLYYQMGVHA